MTTFTGFVAQCIRVGDAGARNALGTPMPTTEICGPFPTANLTLAPNLQCPSGNCFQTPADIVNRVMLFLFPMAGLALLVVFLSAGYSLLFSRGDSSKVNSAKSRMTYGLVGFALLLVSFLAVRTVSYILGFNDMSAQSK